MHLPWQYLYDDPNFLAISAWTPVVRYLDLPRPRRPLEVESPLRVLAMVSSPTDAVALDVEREKANLEQALEQLVRAGAIELHWLEQATLTALLRELRREDFHIFHYIGHGAYDAGADDGLLLLEDEEERGRAVSGSQARDDPARLHDAAPCGAERLRGSAHRARRPVRRGRREPRPARHPGGDRDAVRDHR